MASDSFTDTNGTALTTHDANWEGINSYDTTYAEIQGNQLVNGENLGQQQPIGFVYNNGQGSDQESQIVVQDPSATENQFVVIQGNTSQDGYYGQIRSTGACRIWRNGSVVATGDTISVPTIPTTYRITKVGSDITFYVAGTQRATYSDGTPLTGGYPGGAADATGVDVAFDDWTDNETSGMLKFYGPNMAGGMKDMTGGIKS